MDNKKLEAALGYLSKGMNPIPTKQNKKPYIEWAKFQKERVTESQVWEWWQKWPTANIGIVTGKISNLMTVDCDSQTGIDAVNELLPDSFLTPTVRTPSGGQHYHFKYRKGLVSRTRALTDSDVRTDGGYIIVPPSKNGKGQYAWLSGLRISDIPPAEMPDTLFDILQAGGCWMDASSSEHIKKGIHYNKQKPFMRDVDLGGSTFANIRQQSQQLFQKGQRDNALFHLANCLVKGGMSEDNIYKYLLFFAANCTPPFPKKETNLKIHSALRRSAARSTSLTATIREFILSTSGNISSTEIIQASTKSTLPEERRKVSAILSRMVKEGFIERVGNQNGIFRRVEEECPEEDWKNACTDTVNLWLPFELNEMIDIPPGSIILFSGSQDAGKSAVMMNIANENQEKWNVHYFSSELNPAAFRTRMEKNPYFCIADSTIRFHMRSDNWEDVIKTKKTDLNVIDYLEIHDNFFLVSKHLAAIHKKLGDAIAIIALQKDPNAKYGRGGSFSQEKPVLSISLDYGVATITKFKGEFRGENPRGKEYRFKIKNGCQLVKVSSWHKALKT